MSRIILFEDPHAPETNVSSRVDSDIWAKYQRNALRYLSVAGAGSEVIATLEYLPYSCEAMLDGPWEEWTSINSHRLTIRVPVELFYEIESEQGAWPNRMAEQFPKIAHALEQVGCRIQRIIAEVELDAENKPVEILEGEELKITSGTLEHALSQARTLIVSHGAPAALDRVHTVFHAYLKAACEREQLPMSNDRPGTVELLGLLKKHHAFFLEPELESLVNQTLRGVQKSVDALESFRNQHSLAHPQEMLPEPEALLVINLTQAMLRYLDARLPHP